VTAARQLVADLSQQGVQILVVRDFDKSGFSILHTLRSNTWRWQYATPPQVGDLGLRPLDVEALTLQSELVTYDSKVDPRENLLSNGATVAECDFLVTGQTRAGWSGQRVELNAMTSPQLVHWLEEKLQAAGVRKVIPDAHALAQAYQRQVRIAHLQQAIDAALTSLPASIPVPPDLAETLARQLAAHPAQPWDDALWTLVQAQKTGDPYDAA
jgi:hypothetical protein